MFIDDNLAIMVSFSAKFLGLYMVVINATDFTSATQVMREKSFNVAQYS